MPRQCSRRSSLLLRASPSQIATPTRAPAAAHPAPPRATAVLHGNFWPTCLPVAFGEGNWARTAAVCAPPPPLLSTHITLFNGGSISGDSECRAISPLLTTPRNQFDQVNNCLQYTIILFFNVTKLMCRPYIYKLKFILIHTGIHHTREQRIDRFGSPKTRTPGARRVVGVRAFLEGC